MFLFLELVPIVDEDIIGVGFFLIHTLLCTDSKDLIGYC